MTTDIGLADLLALASEKIILDQRKEEFRTICQDYVQAHKLVNEQLLDPTYGFVIDPKNWGPHQPNGPPSLAEEILGKAQMDRDRLETVLKQAQKAIKSAEESFERLLGGVYQAAAAELEQAEEALELASDTLEQAEANLSRAQDEVLRASQHIWQALKPDSDTEPDEGGIEVDALLGAMNKTGWSRAMIALERAGSEKAQADSDLAKAQANRDSAATVQTQKEAEARDSVDQMVLALNSGPSFAIAAG